MLKTELYYVQVYPLKSMISKCWRNHRSAKFHFEIRTRNLYESNDVFHIDETGLFWILHPNKTMAFKRELCTVGKKSNDPLTILVGANMSGREKSSLFVIGKSNKLRCFKNAIVPVDYMANSKVWMTSFYISILHGKCERRLIAKNVMSLFL